MGESMALDPSPTRETNHDEQHSPRKTQPRRPKTKVVPSRFMSPVVKPSSSRDFHPLASRSPRRPQQDHDRFFRSEENIPGNARSLDASFGLQSKSSVSLQRMHPATKSSNKENGRIGVQQQNASTSRSGTPLPATSFKSRTATPSSRRSNEINAAPNPSYTEVDKLIQLNLMSSRGVNRVCGGSKSDGDSDDEKSFPKLKTSRSCDSSPVNICHKMIPGRNSDRGNDNFLFGDEKNSASMIRTSSRTLKMGGLPPTLPKMDNGDGKKGRKISSHPEEMHSLKLLRNNLVQWAYINAKSKACACSQMEEAKNSVCSLGIKLLALRDLVTMKRVELKQLQRKKMLSTVLNVQMPYLDEWYAFQKDYSVSFLDVVQALSNASINVPVSGNVRIDIKSISEAMNTASNVMKQTRLELFMPKTAEIDCSLSSLASLFYDELHSVEICGHLLSKTHLLQVKETSLMSHLIQCQPSTTMCNHHRSF